MLNLYFFINNLFININKSFFTNNFFINIKYILKFENY